MRAEQHNKPEATQAPVVKTPAHLDAAAVQDTIKSVTIRDTAEILDS